MYVMLRFDEVKLMFPGVLVLFKTVICLLLMDTTEMSVLPSPSRSPKSSPTGMPTVTKLLGAAKDMVVPLLVLWRTAMLELSRRVAAMSGFRSPSRSPIRMFFTDAGSEIVVTEVRLSVPGVLLFATMNRLLKFVWY